MKDASGKEAESAEKEAIARSLVDGEDSTAQADGDDGAPLGSRENPIPVDVPESGSLIIPEPEPATLPSTGCAEYIPPGPIIPPAVRPLAKTYTQAELDRMETATRIRHVWTVTAGYTEQAVMAAEELLGPGTGEAKKMWVENQVGGMLEKLEEKHNFLPDWLQGIVFGAARLGIGMVSDRVVGALKARGQL